MASLSYWRHNYNKWLLFGQFRKWKGCSKDAIELRYEQVFFVRNLSNSFTNESLLRSNYELKLIW